ncbi:hypothetical protein HK102_001683 [Quaeritorhiza haematococci]|nr:hypothetical protein HK102_001683 [Quaeritorhiza haematococci]
MDKADSDFLQQLFRENNELRFSINSLQRELYNKTVQLENAEDEVRQIKAKLEKFDKDGSSRPMNQPSSAKKSSRPVNVDNAASNRNSKELEEALFALERKNGEMKQLREELAKTQATFEQQKSISEQLERDLADAQEELRSLRAFRTQALKDAELAAQKASLSTANNADVTPADALELREQLETAEATIQALRKQVVDIAVEANRKHNEQQNQLQGLEALIESVKREYEEFIQTTKMENEAFRAQHRVEYENLRAVFEKHKLEQFDQKKKLMMEYQGLLLSLQAQFDEYRETAEYLFNIEISKLEDELTAQCLRHEQEMMYIVQVKDKFYSDVMVAKDGKIMSLIEGSDLQALMQKNELDMENLRKEHHREIERIKSDQESESKNIIVLLQRQNVSLEGKCDKLQLHLKTLDARVKELINSLEAKNKMLADKDEQRMKIESDFLRKLEDANMRAAQLFQEKEQLRHKVIRMNLDAKGEGNNSIGNMVKRIKRETNVLNEEFDALMAKYDDILQENQDLTKQLREKQKFISWLEKEINRRNEEFQNMTRTFEEFLAARARQTRRDRATKLMHLHSSADGSSPTNFAEGDRGKLQTSPLNAKSLVKAKIPDGKDLGLVKLNVSDYVKEHKSQKSELERGYLYLRRFKMLSRAFATGDFRTLPNAMGVYNQNGSGPWEKTPLYTKLDDATLTVARLYKDPLSVAAEISPKPALYVPEGPRTQGSERGSLSSQTDAGIKIYNSKAAPPPIQQPQTSPEKKKESQDKDIVIVGGSVG